MMIAFCDLPDTERFRLRDLIEALGGDIDGYSGTDVQVVLPLDWRGFTEAMALAGLVLVPGSRFYFPLGSDCDFAPDHQRHDASYPGSRGFWCLARFNVPAFCLM